MAIEQKSVIVVGSNATEEMFFREALQNDVYLIMRHDEHLTELEEHGSNIACVILFVQDRKDATRCQAAYAKCRTLHPRLPIVWITGDSLDHEWISAQTDVSRFDGDKNPLHLSKDFIKHLERVLKIKWKKSKE